MDLETILTRKKSSESSFRGTTEDHIYFWGENAPPPGTTFLGGNVVYEVMKDGKNDHNHEIENQGGRERAHPSLIRNHGSLLFVRRTVYELTDSEWGWRH
jgi:hypothetical protein